MLSCLPIEKVLVLSAPILLSREKCSHLKVKCKPRNTFGCENNPLCYGAAVAERCLRGKDLFIPQYIAPGKAKVKETNPVRYSGLLILHFRRDPLRFLLNCRIQETEETQRVVCRVADRAYCITTAQEQSDKRRLSSAPSPSLA